MTKRRRWSIALLGAAVLLVGVCYLPDLSVRRELAAARAEGLWTTPGEIRIALRTERNAALAVREAIAVDRADRPRLEPLERLAGSGRYGTVARVSQAEATATMATHRARLARWRTIANQPSLDFQRPWDAPLLTRPELGGVSKAIRWFQGAALANADREASLLTASRLSRLLAQEPGMPPFFASVFSSTRTLRIAQRYGLGKRVLAELGPPLSLADALRAELVGSLNLQRDIRRREGWDILRLGHGLPWAQRLSGLRPFAMAGEAGTIRLYRALFRYLKKTEGDPVRQYAAFILYGPALQAHLSLYAKGLSPYRYASSMDGERTIRDYMSARADVR